MWVFKNLNKHSKPRNKANNQNNKLEALQIDRINRAVLVT